jgi:FkbM family methyltransferase
VDCDPYSTPYFDDEGVLDLVAQIVRPGMTVIDVGAHWGEFALFAARFALPGGTIHAFEPSSRSYRRLEENIQHAKHPPERIILNRAALHNTLGALELNEFPERFSGWNSIGRAAMTLADGRTLWPVGSEIVTALTLDAYCEQRQVSEVDLLKIDVEGFELEVIEGCSELLRQSRIHRIIFEISLAPLHGANRTAREVLERIASYGLQISRIEAGGELVPIRALDDYEAPFFANYLAHP